MTMGDEIAAPSARNDALRGNPKLQALNPKQILISKFKVQNRFGHLDFGHLILFSISDFGFRILSGDCHAFGLQ